ncbi:hypothetical protein Cni_G07703 [Canna indica]|uniref:GATA-type domain-containing protein n=1 Tax=Canna indica TaxID=4628 RepID=A0AAQ3JZH7_9LILI|nr:hypothetical protein Cni_G07703 [Canna indica]
MAPEWEMGMALDLGMEMGMAMPAAYSTSSPAVAPLSSGATAAAPAYVNYGYLPPADETHDFYSLDIFSSTSADTHLYSTATMEPSYIPGDFQSLQKNSFDLYIPQCDDAAELEWLSQFVEDSFSDAPHESGTASAIAAPSSGAQLQVEQAVNGRGARSKRSRTATGAVPAAAWSSLEAALHSPSSSSSSSSSEFPQSNSKAAPCRGKKAGGECTVVERGVRRCTHCASDKTPQWRTGPLGPKTLCNACGVRYKSGRLVPEYRPAASPTFVPIQHSNSHRKVMELRRQKEILLSRRRETNPGDSWPETFVVCAEPPAAIPFPL